MGKSQETSFKKEREKKKKLKKDAKAKRKEERKMNSDGSAESFTYVDKFGNFSDTPPPPAEKMKAEDIDVSTPKKEDRATVKELETERTGVVTFYNDAKGYGFIKDKSTQESVFVHVNNTTEPITEGNMVTFEVEKGHKGPTAVKVTVKR
ncbi:MAG: cold shock domain-containing protein [Bacteroidetes bacterium]|uniref:Cold shock domain-containing protein n=1 Tax=Phaeocystidibacter marisrubri TaxID=1577780 RepID=A0A6L3ZDW5_9FLAO|nr:cold shock domain-containing protein [Phaeocystidibacter marisrubri]KAB2815634.1 cold shock domain-containing protein [Phaeocystidibacter marisrubri]TNE28027.1 MAG: cold shock domain-containing protein [Bacteroidota bacterium]GGH64911.1 cold-shock protein [Phaeocystidibacter marisrubri]